MVGGRCGGRLGVAARTFEDADGQHEERGNEGEDAGDCDSDESEGEQDEPDERIENESEKR